MNASWTAAWRNSRVPERHPGDRPLYRGVEPRVRIHDVRILPAQLEDAGHDVPSRGDEDRLTRRDAAGELDLRDVAMRDERVAGRAAASGDHVEDAARKYVGERRRDLER
jgi:hypothetical protein